MAQRPYFKYGGEQLRDLFASNRDNPEIVTALRAELEHRSTAKMRALLIEVEARLTALARRGATEDQDPSVDGLNSPLSADGGPKGANLPPDDRRRPAKFTLVQHPGVGGRPSKYTPALSHDLVLDVPREASRAKRFSAAVSALVAEMKATGSGSRTFILNDGSSTDIGADGFGYLFQFVDETDIFEEARVEVLHGNQRCAGFVVSILPGRIILCLDEDLGPRVRTCVLRVDNTALLVALRDRLDEVERGEFNINLGLADAVLSTEDGDDGSATLDATLKDTDLLGSQVAAVRGALQRSVFYIWGPPGTGKTHTLAVLVGALFDADKRVLVCSNTNQAVDQLLVKLCRHLARTKHPALNDGKILRTGHVTPERLEECGDYLIVDRIVERLSRELHARRSELQARIAEVEASLAPIDQVLRLFDERERVLQEIHKLTVDLDHHRNAQKRARDNLEAAERRHVSDRRALEVWRLAGQLRRVLMSSEARLTAQLEASALLIRDSTLKLSDLTAVVDRAKHVLTAHREHTSTVDQDLASHDRSRLLEKRRSIENERAPVRDELAKIQGQLDDLERSLLASARVIGTTVTRAYLSAKDMGVFDAVIVDEASMVLLPALYLVAGLARERVTISGDFNQLPPIVQSNQAAVLDEIGADVFKTAGVTTVCRMQTRTPRVTMLDEQLRMVQPICDLIVEGMDYKGLRTHSSTRERSERAVPPAPFDGPLTLIDSSRLWPFESRNLLGSRFNLMHTLLARNLCWHLRRSGFIIDKGSLGVCTPYAAQAKLMSEILKDEDLGELVTASTVHRFQGDEKRMIVLDIPESIGSGFNIGRFIQADDPDDDGSKLQNVALSRTEDHLVVLANLTYLDAKLPSNAKLRLYLYEMQRRGAVVNAEEVLALRPIAEDLKDYGGEIAIDWDGADLCVFRQEGFDRLFQVDVAGATSSVAVFSGFVTPQRVGAYGDLFRQKVLDGVSVRCVTRPPWRNGSMDPKDTARALDALEGVGVVVDTRAVIHEKVVIVDDKIVWFGSLNPLSHTSRTDELMQRVVSKGYASKLAGLLSIAPSAGTDGDGFAARRENPRCNECGARMCYLRGRWGPYFKCEGCGHNQKLFGR